MRFHLGPIPDEFEPDGSWRPIREPGPVLMQVIALPVGIGSAALAGLCWHRAWPAQAGSFHHASPALLAVFLLLSFPVLIVMHEFLHAAVFPSFGLTRASVIGLWPKGMLFYAHHSGPLSRNRFIAVFAMPLLVITVLPIALAATGLLPPALMPAAAWFSIWNAFFACGDCLGMALFVCQIPRSATVQNKGWRTFWKPMTPQEPPH